MIKAGCMKKRTNYYERHRRYYFTAHEKITATLNNKNKVIPLNISQSGFAFQCESELDIDLETQINIKIEWPRHKIVMELTAEVIWIIDDNTGVIFTNITQEQEDKLERLIAVKISA